MTSSETVLYTLGITPLSVKEITENTGLSESVVRKTLKALVADEQVTLHETTPTTFSKDIPYSLEASVEGVLGKKARSAGYIHQRLSNRGVTVTKAEVRSALVTLVLTGRATLPFKRSQRFVKV
jgi:hypothetical protein